MDKIFTIKLLVTLISLAFLFSFSGKAQNAWINEIHYDDSNSPSDVDERVEVIVENPSSYNLSLFSVVLYNGASTSLVPYDTKTLDNFTVGNSTGSFTLYYYTYPTNGIQNGAPDGLALVYDGILITGQFLSYEGTFVAASGPAAGQTSADIGVAETNSTPVGHSLQLSGNGTQYSDFTWQFPATATPGTLNNNQAVTASGVQNPANFNATTFSQTQIDLTWNQNGNGNNVMVAWNSSDAFGTPSGTYAANDPITGGGIVIYNGPAANFYHTGLTAGLHYYYKAWSVDGSNNYSPGVIDSAYTQFLEPSGHPNGLAAMSNGPVSITVSWTDSDAAHYLVKGSTAGYGSIATPSDGVAEPDAALLKNVNPAVQQHQFTGLIPGTQYYFKIFPYNGTGSAVNYKTDGTVPAATATTHDLDIDLFISEIADPSDSSNAKFIELYNPGITAIDFSSKPVYICRQSNGASWQSFQLTGILPPNDELVLAYVSTSFDPDTVRFFNAYDFEADIYQSIISGNGNDGYYLSYGGNQATGYIFDAFGVINQDGSGQPWEYTDKKAVRKRTVSMPNPSWTASEWTILDDPASHEDMTPGFHRGDVTWQGSSSSNWNEKGPNWNSPYGYIPDASCNVILPNVAQYPLVARPSACNELLIQSGSALSISPTGVLLVVGP